MSALLTVAIDNGGTGSETQASGCGPATAVYGTHGLVVALAPTFVQFTNNENCSGVSVGHLLYLATGSTNRRFSAITRVHATTVATTASGTIEDYTCTVADASGISAGDIVYNAGDGAYHVVAGVAGTLVSFNEANGLSYTNTALTRYAQVTVTDNMAVGSAYTWACGGKRASLDVTAGAETRRLFVDAKPGWWIDIAAGTDYDIGSTAITVTCAGDTTTGRILVMSSSAARPIIKTSGTNNIFECNAAHYVTFHHLTLKSTNGSPGHGVRYYTGVSNYAWIDDCLFDGLSSGIYIYIASEDVVASLCTFKDCKLAGIAQNNSISPATATALGCLFYTTQGTPTGYYGIRPGSYGLTLRAYDCVFYNLDTGVYGTASSSKTDDWTVENCTFHTMLADAVHMVATSGYAKLMNRNNVFWSIGGYGVNHVNSTVAASDAMCRMNVNCAFGSCTSGRVNGISDPGGYVTLTGDPCISPASLDFRLDATANEGAAARAAAWPNAVPYPGGGQSNYLDLGALQHQDAGGGAVGGVSRGRVVNA